MAQPIKKPWLTPKGRKLCEPYQKPDEVSWIPSLEREGAEGGLKPLLEGKKGLGMFLKKFLYRKKISEEKIWFFFKKNIK